MPDDQTFVQTAGTLVFLGVWAVMVLGPLLGVANRPRLELMIAVTMVVFTILGRMWDFQVKRQLNGFPITTSTDDSEDD